MTDSRYKPFQTKQMFNMICTIKGYLTRAMVFGMLLTGTYLAGIAVAPIISPRDAKAVPDDCEINTCLIKEEPCFGVFNGTSICGLCVTYDATSLEPSQTNCAALMIDGMMTCTITPCLPPSEG